MRKSIERALAIALVGLFVASVLAVVWQVVGRYLLSAPSSATEELARFLLIWLGLLSMAYAFARRMHMGVDLISDRLSPKSKRLVARFIWLSCAIFAVAVMVYGGGLLVQITATLGQTSAAFGLPMWMIYTVLPVTGMLIAGLAVSFLIDGTSATTDGNEEDGQ